MNKISMTLLRTVFLPVGSPPIGSVCEITADIGKADIHVEGEQVYCLGEMDIIIDYLSFSPNSGRHLFPDHADTYPGGGGKEWQAMINLPFALNETADLDAKAEYTASIRRYQMVYGGSTCFRDGNGNSYYCGNTCQSF